MKISVIIPARNEAAVIARCVLPIVRQLKPFDEIIVVDDNSTDGTDRIARAAGASTVLHTAGLQHTMLKSHTGKAMVANYGALLSRGDVLVFIDADVMVGEGFLDAVRIAYADSAPPVFWWPHQRLEGSLLAELIVPFMFLWAATDNHAALGQCITMQRRDYLRLNPFEAVMDQPVDDIAMAAYFRSKEQPYKVVDASRLLSCHMYRDNESALQGFLRLLYPAMLRPFWRSIFMHLLLVTFNPFVMWHRLRLADKYLHSRRSAYLHPFTHLLFLTLTVGSWWRYRVSGNIQWKGRSISV